MGGPKVSDKDEAVLAERLAATGLDPKLVGERVVDAIRTKTFYAFVSAVPADVIRARHRRIEDALEQQVGHALLRGRAADHHRVSERATRTADDGRVSKISGMAMIASTSISLKSST